MPEKVYPDILYQEIPLFQRKQYFVEVIDILLFIRLTVILTKLKLFNYFGLFSSN